jgi:predicted nicotinamide N-methyase
VQSRPLRFVRPRSAAALAGEEDGAAGFVYPPHWAEPWPSGVELAHAVAADDWHGAAVVDLGCGLGLPSVAAAGAGARVLATDRSPDAVTFAAVNAECTGVVIETAVCRWAEPRPLLERAPWRLVLAADVLYGQECVDELLELLPRLVDDNGEVLLADPQRPLAAEFLAAAQTAWRSVDTAPTRRPEIRLHRLAGPR